MIVTTLAEALNAVLVKVAENNAPVPGDCEKIAEVIAVLQTWYSQQCPGA